MRALVLPGGANKGAYEVGVLQHWMLDLKKDWEIVAGVSVGAINAAALSQFPVGQTEEAFAKLSYIWDQVEPKRIYKKWFLGYLAVLWKNSVFNSTPLKEWIANEYDVTASKLSGKKMIVGAVNWTTGEYRLVDQYVDNVADWVYASASYPVFFSPVEIEGQLWTDGGARTVVPLGAAIRAGADEIDVIMNVDPYTQNSWSTDKKKTFSYVFRILDILSAEVVRNDLEIAGLKNELAELAQQYKHVKINVHYPPRSVTADSLNFDPAEIKLMRELGYEDACKASGK